MATEDDVDGSALEAVLDALEEQGCKVDVPSGGIIVKDGFIHRALKVAEAVRKLTDFGGGNLRLADGSVWRLFPACSDCKNADRVRLSANTQVSRYCARCAEEKLYQRPL